MKQHDVRERWHKTSANMVEAYRGLLGHHSKDESDSLRSVILVTEKFNAEICILYPGPFDPRENIEYWCESIYAEVDCFRTLRDVCRTVSDSPLLTWSEITVPELMETFKERYRAFYSETEFGERLVALLDLVKLQILWAALHYR